LNNARTGTTTIMSFAAVGIGAITLVSLLLGWALLAVAGTTGRGEERAAASPPLSTSLPVRVPVPSAPRRRQAANTLTDVQRARAHRRRDPVSGQVPRTPTAAPRRATAP